MKYLTPKLFAALLISIFIMSAPTQAYATQSTTLTYGINRKGWFVQTQDAYLPDRNITDLRLKNPESMMFGEGDILYIADTGNRRVVLYDIKTAKIVQEISHPDFKTPRGLYVTPDGTLYVADSSAGSVFCFNKDGDWVKTIARPDTLAFGDTPFAPYRIAADPRGSLYIIGEGVYNGVIQLSGAGEFLGYFTSNETTLTWVEFLQDIFFTETQKAGLMDRVPITFSNVFADKRGVIYSTTMGKQFAGLKKHNMAGKNMFPDVWTTESTTSVTVDDNGIIYTTDIGGFIGVYANDGSEVFFFGTGRRTDEDIAGMYTSLMSIAISSNGDIWTLDSEKAFLQSYTPTEYALSVFRAIKLFNEGKYAAGGEEWTNVLRYNQMSVLAHNGLGKTYLYQQKYNEAQTHFEVAGNRYYFSEAFWETRNQWLLDNLVYILFAVVALIIFFTALKYIDRKKRLKNAVHSVVKRIRESKRLKNVYFAFSVARHPLDSYYDMKIKIKGTNKSAMVMFLLFFISFMVYQTSKAFIIQYLDVEDMDFNVIIGGFFGISALFIFSNYLVTSINDGEGSISDIFKVVSYSTLPLTGTLFLCTAISYVITLNELFLISLILGVGIVWSVSILYLGLQEMHNYSVGNTIKSIIITFAFMVIALIVLFNLSILFSQFTQFAEAVIRELIANVSGTY